MDEELTSDFLGGEFSPFFRFLKIIFCTSLIFRKKILQKCLIFF
jgi:hypothetical protein